MTAPRSFVKVAINSRNLSGSRTGVNTNPFALDFGLSYSAARTEFGFISEGKAMAEARIPETADIGLAGVVAFTSKISAIMGTTLTYCGYAIEDLAENSTFEETAYLLWHGELPTESQLAEWRATLGQNMQVPEELVKFHIRSEEHTS